MSVLSKQLWFFFGLLCLFSSLPVGALAQATPAIEMEPLLIGAVEVVTVEPDRERIALKARIDTGAKTSSLGAVGVVRYERDGKPWVRFKIHDPGSGELVEFSREIQKTIRVKRHGTESQKRFVVEMWVKLGPYKLMRLFSLTDRSDFEFPLLIGRNVLAGTAVVDVSEQYTQGKPVGGH